MIQVIFGNPITRKVETKKKIEGQVEVLKKEQKVKVEEKTKEYEVKKKVVVDDTTAAINMYKARIASLEKEKKDKVEMLDKELKVEINKVINMYDQRIVSKQNKAKKLGYYIEAEQQNIQDVINPEQPNAPTDMKGTIGFDTKKVLLEEKELKKKK